MAIKFGNTWWGNEWLKSLNNIDFDNRIPRGATYARQGKVQQLSIQQNAIIAKVAGSSPYPYKVNLLLPPFKQQDIDRLINALEQYPNIISQLLNRELDPKVMEIALGCGLQIFPRQWKDLKMNCSCPDWAVPCKHIAAVIYKICQEIDNNPLIVFSLHQVDIIAELERRGWTLGNRSEDNQVTYLNDLVQLSHSPSLTLSDAFSDTSFVRADFSEINDNSEALFLLLTDRPPFCSSFNFKQIYVDEIRHIKKCVQRFLTKRKALDEMVPATYQTVTPLTPNDVIHLTFNQDMEWEVTNDKYNVMTLTKALLQINPDFLPDYHPTVIGLHQTLLCTVHLLANAMVAPQIVQLEDKQYRIKWNPAYTDQHIQKMVSELENNMPASTIQFEPALRSTPKAVEKQSQWAISLFAQTLIHCQSRKTNWDPLYLLFFKEKENAFNEIGTRETPGGIKAWTSAFTLQESDYRPVFFIEENKQSGFDLHFCTEHIKHPEKGFVPLQEILSSKQYQKERLEVLKSFTLISKFIRKVNEHINSGAQQDIHYTNDEFIRFINEVIPAIKMLDFKLFIPKSLQNLIHPKPSLKIQRKTNANTGYISLSDLFDFNWQVALGQKVVSIEDFLKLTKQSEGLIKIKGAYIYTSPEELDKLKETFEDNKTFTSSQLLQIALAGEYEAAPISLTEEAKALLKEMTEERIIDLPQSLNATLRPYQHRGFSWMYRNRQLGFGSILADDMGLGKTIQAISLILKLKEENALTEGKVLIVVPTGLLSNWLAEIEHFAPSLTTFLYYGDKRSMKNFSSDILLTTYGILRSDCTKIKKLNWTLMFIDEAQNIKNYDTAQSKAIKSVPAHTHIALSGTPVENRLTEFWSIMEFANKGYLGTIKEFNEKFAKPIQIYNSKERADFFKRITAPFMMRRMKTDKRIITDLPDKIELNDYAALKPEQAALYNATLEAAMAEIEGIADTDAKSLFKRQGLILQMILALKQICNHPSQFLKNKDYRSELSGKTEMLLERIETIVANDEKVLVFTQFTEMGNMLVEFIKERTGKQPLFYHGGCSVKDRTNMVERFQNNRADNVFILSLKAAGTGLNLTAATHVIHYDLWWNPAVEAQATDRAYRIGQQNNVMVHRYITKDTFEEKIDAMIQQKKHLAEMTVASGESWIGKLSNKELRDIFG